MLITVEKITKDGLVTKTINDYDIDLYCEYGWHKAAEPVKRGKKRTEEDEE